MKAVIFDMDGTIVEPLLDFAAIRAEACVPEGADILAWVESLPRGDRARAYETLLSHELPAARNAALMPGAATAVRAVRTAGMKTALLTRTTQTGARRSYSRVRTAGHTTGARRLRRGLPL